MVEFVTAVSLALVVYAAGHYLCALLFLSHRRRPKPPAPEPDAVTVLVPALDEGESAVHCLRSIVAQDHEGPVVVKLLIADEEDTALEPVRAAFGMGEDLVAEPAPGRRVEVLLLGVRGKAAKIRAASDAIETPWTAILDADHVAHREWIRSALGCIAQARSEGTKTRMVQGRRYPIAARGLFRFWDSLQQHVGCELLNVAFQRMGLSVFFTGTTALMDTALLREHPLRDVLTEDIDFSYATFMAGEVIVADPRHGSAEEVSPDLYSFLARRRRWANGHTEAFLRHLPKLWKARLPLSSKVQFLFHGLHYLVIVPVFLLHLAVGLLFLEGLPLRSIVASGVSALFLSLLIGRSQRTKGWLHRSLEVSVLFVWLAPALLIASNVVLALVTGDPSRASLPLDSSVAYIEPLTLAAFGAPLVLLLIGLVRFRQLGLGTALGLVVTYPIAFYLDGAGALLGCLDAFIDRQRWRKVARSSDGPNGEVRPVGLRESWRIGGGLALRPEEEPRRWGAPALMALATLAFAAGIFGWPERVVAASDLRCERHEADDLPWIDDEATAHCDGSGPRLALRAGSPTLLRDDPMDAVDDSFWERGDATFPCNESYFTPGNVEAGTGGVTFALREESRGDRRFTSGSLSTGEDGEFHFGRFEVTMKASPASGVVSAFFLYRFDPWQEIDFELVGKDTTKALLNVYYNPGDDGDLYNYGHFGTPVVVDLGFDAAEDFHRYAIEWDAEEIRWFADDRLIHVRRAGEPTPIPQLPMVFHLNAWATCSEDLAGPIDTDALPTAVTFRDVRISRWDPAPRSGLDALFGIGDPAPDSWTTP
jgi:cellulose synthase/poly-beta-1,6-N-acetylglucosamine synthase-like glycosyltransferase